VSEYEKTILLIGFVGAGLFLIVFLAWVASGWFASFIERIRRQRERVVSDRGRRIRREREQVSGKVFRTLLAFASTVFAAIGCVFLFTRGGEFLGAFIIVGSLIALSIQSMRGKEQRIYIQRTNDRD
jgi:hypothetical protein